MNYLFRPTPVVVLGRDMGADVVTLAKPPAGVMLGSPGRSGRPSRSLATQGAPWIVRSGTMASFGTLGQDASGADGVGVDTSGTGDGFDYSGAYGSPNLPSPVPPDFPVAPDIGFPAPPSGLAPFSPVPWASPAPPPPPSGAGSTGQSIPGTQPIVQSATQGISLFQRIFGAGKPPQSVVIPAVGVNPRQPPPAVPSFWTTSSILPGTPNSTVVLGGAAALILLLVLSAGGKSGR